jgi:hypothetical protein
MGKVKIAQTLARAALDLGATTVGWMLREDPTPKPRPNDDAHPARQLKCQRQQGCQMKKPEPDGDKLLRSLHFLVG